MCTSQELRRERLRVGQKMAYLFSILRDETHLPYIWQYLERFEAIFLPTLRVAPGGEQNFEFSGARKSKSLKNRAAARASEAAQTTKSRDFAPDK